MQWVGERRWMGEKKKLMDETKRLTDETTKWRGEQWKDGKTWKRRVLDEALWRVFAGKTWLMQDAG